MIIKKIKPLFTSIVTTARKYCVDEVSDSGLIKDLHKMAGTLKEFQTVVAVGDSVRNIKVGDLVRINPANYEVRKFKENSIKNEIMENDVVRYNFNMVELEGVPHLLLNDRDIFYVIEDYEEDEPVIMDATPSLII